MGKDDQSSIPHECQYKCRSEKHGSNLTAALTKDSFSDEQIVAYWKWCCVRYAQAVDENGRTLLHMAAAKGRVTLLKYLLKHRDINVNKKDKESHFSALHCCLFYGNIHCATHLIKAGANLEQFDLDDLTAFDHISADRPLNVRDLDSGAHDVYVWGANMHYTLGIGHHQSREYPEALETFKRQNIFFKQVLMNKYHSAFLARDGRLWMCGHGQGGRLGLEKEITVLTPRLVNIGAANSECHAVALGTHHTIVVMGDKTVWSFGLNTFHQLGHDPPPEKVIMPKFVRGLRQVGILGVSAAKYHSAFWSETRLYTCGLNGGQLGHTRDSGRTIVVPKAVSGLRQCGIKLVTCTDGATVLANSYGEIYLFYDYICRKITSRPFYPKLVCALGGHLDHRILADRLKENGGEELQVLVVTTCNSIYLWKESDRRYLKYDLSYRRRVININDITFNNTFVVLTSRDGKAYHGDIIGKRTLGLDLYSGPSRNIIKLTRIPFIHRAVLVTSDPGGRNFAITQFQPKSRLYNFPRVTTAEADTHMKNLFQVLDQASFCEDVIFEVEGRQFLAHRYIVGHASKVLEEMMNEAVQPDGTCIVKIEDIGSQVFRALLCYIYTKDFNLISPFNTGTRYDFRKTCHNAELDETKLPFECNSEFCDGDNERPMTGKEKGLYMKMLEKAAHVLGVRSLKDEFEGEDMLYKRSRVFPTNLVKFDRERLPYLWDVTLRSEDGAEIRAHKCILISRLEYFNCMMNNKSWIESTQKEAVCLPVPGKVLHILINFLYTGAAPLILKSEDADLVITTLVMADQLFCNGLKNICEYTLSKLMNLQNVSEILQVGLTYNAGDLKRYAMEFICQNLAYLLETRSLENLPDSVMQEVSAYYRSRVPQMCMRQITAYCNAPDDELVDLITETEPVTTESILQYSPAKSLPRTPRKKNKQKRNSQFVRSKSLDSLIDSRKSYQNLMDANSFVGRRDDPPWIKVVAHTTKKQKNDERKEKSPVEVSKKTTDLKKEDKHVRARLVPLKAISMNSVTDIQCPDASSERDFPALKPSYSERNIDSYPPSVRLNTTVSEKIFRFSNRQTKKQNRQSSDKNKEIPNRSVAAAMSPVDLLGSYSYDDSDSSEVDTISINSHNSLGSEGCAWKSTPAVCSNLNEITACEQKEEGHMLRMKSKSLVHIQMEEKAMEELLVFYNADIVKDERITVRRANDEFQTPPPVWVANRK